MEAGGAGGWLLPLETEAMEAKAAATLPLEQGWQYEPKWDGFRCIAFKAGGGVELRAKSGKSLTRYFPEVVAALERAEAPAFVVDGELTITRGGTLDFAALQDRLHPAESRVRRLAGETPARLILFDCLAGAEGSLMDAPLPARRAALEQLWMGPGTRLTPFTREAGVAATWLAETGGALDGVMAKRLDAPYAPGVRAMLKVKRLRSADCVVGGFRRVAGGGGVGSMLLGLYDGAGLLDHVGFTSAIAEADRAALTALLEAQVGGPGFTGQAPGKASRWSTGADSAYEPLHHRLVAEVRYDHATGGRFRHGTLFLRWRPDKAPGQCTSEQLAAPADPQVLVRALQPV